MTSKTKGIILFENMEGIKGKRGYLRFSLSGLLSGIIDWLIVLCCIGLTGAIPFLDKGSFITNHDSTVRLFLFFLIAVRCIICLPKGIKPTQNEVVSFVFVGIMFAVSLLAGRKSVLYAVGRVYAPIIIGFFVALTMDEKQLSRFMKRFVQAMTIIAFASLILWWSASIMHKVTNSSNVTFMWDEEHVAKVYNKIYYEPDWQQFNLLGQYTYKNCGIFAEPPMFGFLLCLSWMFHRIMHKTIFDGWYVYIIIGLTILSTFCVTAIIAILIYEGVIFGLKKSRSIYVNVFKTFLFLCLACLALFYASGLLEDKFQSGSGNVRKAHLLASLKMFFQYPISGLGFGNAMPLQEMSGYKQGLSIGLPAVWALGGIGILFVTTIPFFSLGTRCVIRKQWRTLAYSIASLWIYICTAVFFISPIPWIAIMYMIKSIDEKDFDLSTVN